MTDPQGHPDAEPARPGDSWSPESGQLAGWHPTPPPGSQRPYLYEPTPVGDRSGQPPPSGVRNRRNWARAGGGLAGGAGVAAKLFVVLKAGAVLVKFKVVGSMAIAIGVYTLVFGWWFAVGLVALLLVHELGHFFVLRALGVKVSAPMFIPFMGAFVKMESQPRSVAHEAVGALAGPAVGVVGALAALELSHVFDSPLLRALAYAGFFINLFNLFPVLPLDGGRVAGALHPGLWIAGLAAAVVYAIVHPRPIIIFIIVIGAFELVRRWRTHKWVDAAYYAIPPATRVRVGAAYAIVAVVCLWGMNVAYVRR